MAKRWERFKYANSSNVDIVNPNKGDANLTGDWHREQTQETLRVNGILLKDIAKNFNEFKKDADVLKFFDQVILKDFVGDESQKKCAIEYLRTTFHQGGFLRLVSSSLASELNAEGKNLGVMSKSLELKMNIQTTPRGFRVQELVHVGALEVARSSLKKLANDSYDLILKTDKDSDGLIQAQGTVDVDFSKNASDPRLSIINNQMNINHPALKKILDNRSLGQIVIDFLKNIVGLNKVIDISPKEEAVIAAPARIEQEEELNPNEYA